MLIMLTKVSQKNDTAPLKCCSLRGENRQLVAKDIGSIYQFENEPAETLLFIITDQSIYTDHIYHVVTSILLIKFCVQNDEILADF